MTTLKSVCVFCGSSNGGDPAFAAAARRLGAILAERRIRLVFGAGRVGMMGIVADAVIAGGGQTVGVIPSHLMEREVGHTGLTELHVVDTMHSRKNLMFELSDGFITLPGGLGTLDETFEIITWRQLRLHDKPIVVLDTGGYWRPLVALVESLIEQQFAMPSARALFSVAATPEEAVRVLEQAPAPAVAEDTRRL